MITTTTAAKPAAKKVQKSGNIEDTNFHSLFINKLIQPAP